ncbi:uncharacterized protein LOC114915521 [Cajanus cajan]|uniref:NHL domain-containing protein n=1 Tax=Cajanus cajan TaxID=3821 RepID=A0A151QPG1_CAJCA|nr:uncharacterized protein LOC114915521 [Cajanus cajan]KYP32197.1 hypothetical protein KK1_047166 [Cajanus cajan]
MLSLSSIKDDDDMQEQEFAKRGCFCIPCLGPSSKMSSSSSGFRLWARMRTPESKERWWAKGWSRIREWSEVVAGPKWKTFIRRFRKNYRPIGFTKQDSFQYGPHSYARNFDDGNGEKLDQDYAYDFSSRYASVPASTKSSMDLGKDGPSFI